jgi:hypothetical protein
VDPVAQVCDTRGTATFTRSYDGKTMDVKKGDLLGGEDLLTLNKGSSVSLYFKSGGRVDLPGKSEQVSYKISDLNPGTKPYDKTVPVFGATRQVDMTEMLSGKESFFYPQQTIVTDRTPIIEFTLFNVSDAVMVPGGANIVVSGNGSALASGQFDRLEWGASYTYHCPDLKGSAEYQIEIILDLKAVFGEQITVSFPLYITGESPRPSAVAYMPFRDSFYRSCESTGTVSASSNRTLWILKRLDTRENQPQPVIVIEFFAT